MRQDREILGRLASYVAANVLGTIGVSCYILADTFFIAQACGADGLTALNLALPAYSLMNGFGLMIGMGGATRYAISQAAGDRSGHERVFSHAMVLCLLCSLPFLLAGLGAARPVALLLGAKGEVAALTGDYLGMILSFAPAYMLNNLMLAFLRNDGAPRLAMTAMLAGSIANIFLDYLLLFPLGLGIRGAALATGIAPCIGLAIQSLHLLRKRNGFRLVRSLPGLRQTGDILSLGLSSLVLELSSGAVLLTFNVLLLSLAGNVGVAAYGVVANIALVVIAVFTGLSQGMQPVLSDCYGRGETRQIRLVYRASLAAALLLAVAVWLLGSGFSRQAVAVFNAQQDPVLAGLAVTGIRIYFVSFLFSGVNIVTAAALSAMNRPGGGFLISILRGLVLMFPAAVGLAALFGVNGVWASVPAAEAATTLLLPLLCRRKKEVRPS